MCIYCRKNNPALYPGVTLALFASVLYVYDALNYCKGSTHLSYFQQAQSELQNKYPTAQLQYSVRNVFKISLKA